MSDWLGVKDWVAVVTGAGGGMGRAIAEAFASQGACVALLDYNQQSCESAAQAVTQFGGRAIGIRCDISKPESVQEAGSRVAAEFGPCRVLVNNAGVLRPGPLDTLTIDEWNAIISVNLTGYFLCSQTFGRPMLEQGRGSIVHVASIAASHPQGFSGAYSTSKAGIVMLSQQLATEWGPRGVRSNVVSPGMIRTPLTADFYATPGVTEQRSAVVPVRRIGEPEDIADSVLFLASDRASYVNGDEITVDGGFTRMVMNLVPRPKHE